MTTRRLLSFLDLTQPEKLTLDRLPRADCESPQETSFTSQSMDQQRSTLLLCRFHPVIDLLQLVKGNQTVLPKDHG